MRASSPSFRRRGRGPWWSELGGPMLVAAVLSALFGLGVAEVFEAPLYDRLVALRARLVTPSPTVLLVETPRGAADRRFARALVDRLSPLAPAGIVFTDVDRDDPPLPTDFATAPPIVLAVRPTGDERVERPRRDDRPTAAEDAAAWSFVGPGEGGVHRCQTLALAVDGLVRPTAEGAAFRVGRDETAPFERSDRCVGIAFVGGPGSLPRVDDERVLSGSLVRELVAGRWVLVGSGASDALHGVHTPTTSGGQRMSMLEFQGQALNTLLSGEAIRRPPLWMLVLLLVGVGAGMRWLESRARTRWLIALALLLAVVVVLAATVALIAFETALPTASLLVLIGTVHALTLRDRLRFSGQSISRLSSGMLGRLRSRLLPDGVYLGDDPWPQVFAAVDGALGTERSVLLEAAEGDRHLRPIYAAGCSFDELDPTRFDQTSAPFGAALREGGPIRLDDAAGAVLPLRSAEAQGLVPLRFAGEVHGYWIWSAPRARVAGRNFDDLVKDHSGQIAEVLYHRSRLGSAAAHADDTRPKNPAIGESYAVLQWTSVMLERQLLRIESLLKGLGASVVVFDLFGRVVDVTDTMLERLGREGIIPHQLSAAELVTRLGRSSAEEARGALNGLLANRRSVTLPAYVGPGSEPTTFMILSALEGEAQAEAGEARSSPTDGLLGISLELLETSSMQVLSEVKSQLTERLGEQLARDLVEMRAALRLLREGGDAAGLREQVLGLIDAKMSGLENLVKESREYLSIDLQEMGRSRYPVELAERIERVVDERRENASRRRVDLQVALPEHLGHVLASPAALDNGLRAVLDFLLEDAEPDELLWVRVAEEDDTTQILLSNRGSGYVQEELTEILAHGRESGRPVDRSLAGFCEQLELWGGRLSGTSHIGVGTQFEMIFDRSKHL